MTLFGKILIVLNLLASMVFASVAVMVEMTHKSWRDEVMRPPAEALAQGKDVGLAEQIKAKNAQIATLNAERQKLGTEKNRSELELKYRISQLESANNQVTEQRNTLQADQAQKTEQMQLALERQKVADDRLQKNQEEVEKLREEINAALKDRDDATKLVADLEDKLADEVDDNAKLTARHRQLLDQLSQYKIAFTDARRQLDQTPPRLDGVVLASSDEGFVEVSVGFHDGLEKGHLMEVFRKGATPESNKYLGRIRIVRVESDKAVGQVIPEYRQGKIEKEDHVATRLE
ncbi:MAG: hypothetical protein HYS13_25175 [Planctomycetia bacterium]|nr:hypothetical protein [Planctomycetia bacterium]